MGLKHRVNALWANADHTPSVDERAIDGRALVLFRFLEALPECRREVVSELLVAHTRLICDPGHDLEEGSAPLPAVVRAVQALTGKHGFPDPLPLEWIDLYLAHADASDVATCACQECGLIHPSVADYRNEQGQYWQNWPLCPDWKCLLCGGMVYCNGYQLKHNRYRLSEPLWETMADGGTLTFGDDPDNPGERIPIYTFPDLDPCATFAEGITTS